MANKNGNKTIYTPELAERICKRLAKGESLSAICRDKDMPNRDTVNQWVIHNMQGFTELYNNARNLGLDTMADEVLDIADDGSNDWMESNNPDNPGYKFNKENFGRSRLRVDTRKWYLAKMAPKRYGEVNRLELTGKDGGPVETKELSDTERLARINALYAAAQKRKEQEGQIDDGSDLV